MAIAAAIATAGGWSGSAGLAEHLQALLDLLSPGAAQLLIHPIKEPHLFQDRAGTIPVTADGQLVGRILDIGGGGYHLTANSDAARGTFRRSGDHRWIEFNGTNTAYETAALPSPGVNKAQVFAAMRKTSDTSNRVLVELRTASSTNGSFVARMPFDATGMLRVSSTGITSATASYTHASILAPYTAVLGILADIAAPFVHLRGNGALLASSTSSQGVSNYNPSGASTISLGSRGGTTTFFAGNLYGALVTRFSAANLATEAVEAVEALLAVAITGAP